MPAPRDHEPQATDEGSIAQRVADALRNDVPGPRRAEAERTDDETGIDIPALYRELTSLTWEGASPAH
jgi:hypothetical protein